MAAKTYKVILAGLTPWGHYELGQTVTTDNDIPEKALKDMPHMFKPVGDNGGKQRLPFTAKD